MSRTRDPAILAELPLKATVFEILLALVTEELHGYAIVKQLEDRSGGGASQYTLPSSSTGTVPSEARQMPPSLHPVDGFSMLPMRHLRGKS